MQKHEQPRTDGTHILSDRRRILVYQQALSCFCSYLSGFFSGSETALTASSRGKLRAQADKGSRGAQKALDITDDNERLIGSVLLGNNLVNILWRPRWRRRCFTRAVR